MSLRLALALLLLPSLASAAPITLKEIAFLVRVGTPEAEIAQTVRQRQLSGPLPKEADAELRELGASPNLIALLRDPANLLPPDQARAEQLRRARQQQEIAREAQSDAQIMAERDARNRQLSEQLLKGGAIQKMLDGKLVHLDGDQLKPYLVSQLTGARIFAFYFAAMSNSPSRKFTPQLVEAYQRLKVQYGNLFEIVLVSRDRDEFNMHEFMRTNRITWPAVRFGVTDPKIEEVGGSTLPWLVVVSDSGQPLTRNAVDHKPIPAPDVLGGLEQLLGMVKR